MEALSLLNGEKMTAMKCDAETGEKSDVVMSESSELLVREAIASSGHAPIRRVFTVIRRIDIHFYMASA